MSRTDRLAGEGSRRVTRSVRSLAAVSSLALVLLISSATADATVIKRVPVSGSGTEAGMICGVPVVISFEFSFTGHFRVGKNKVESAFFSHDLFRSTDVITNPATGKFVTLERHTVLQETKATRVQGTIFDFRVVEAGHSTLRDMRGRLVSHDRGAVRFTARFDTLGDAVPGGRLIGFIDEQVRGPHPSFDEDFDCTVIRPLLT